MEDEYWNVFEASMRSSLDTHTQKEWTVYASQSRLILSTKACLDEVVYNIDVCQALGLPDTYTLASYPIHDILTQFLTPTNIAHLKHTNTITQEQAEYLDLLLSRLRVEWFVYCTLFQNPSTHGGYHLQMLRSRQPDAVRSYLRQITMHSAMCTELWIGKMDDYYRVDHVDGKDHLQTLRWYDQTHPYSEKDEISAHDVAIRAQRRDDEYKSSQQLDNIKRKHSRHTREAAKLKHVYMDIYKDIKRTIVDIISLEHLNHHQQESPVDYEVKYDQPQPTMDVIGALFDMDDEEDVVAIAVDTSINRITTHQLRKVNGILLKLRDLKLNLVENETWNEFKIMDWKNEMKEARQQIADWFNEKVITVLGLPGRGPSDWADLDHFINRSEALAQTNNIIHRRLQSNDAFSYITEEKDTLVRDANSINDYFNGCMTNSKEMTMAFLYNECKDTILEPLNRIIDTFPHVLRGENQDIISFQVMIKLQNDSMMDAYLKLTQSRLSVSSLRWDRIRASVWRKKLELDLKSWTSDFVHQASVFLKSVVNNTRTIQETMPMLMSLAKRRVADNGDFMSGECVKLEALELSRIATFDKKATIKAFEKTYIDLANNIQVFIKRTLHPLVYEHRSDQLRPTPETDRFVIRRKQTQSAAAPIHPPLGVPLPPLPRPNMGPSIPHPPLGVSLPPLSRPNMGPSLPSFGANLPPLPLFPSVSPLIQPPLSQDQPSSADGMIRELCERVGLNGNVVGVVDMDLECHITPDQRMRMCTLIRHTNLMGSLGRLIGMAEFRHRREVIELFCMEDKIQEPCNLREMWKVVKALLVICAMSHRS